MLITLWLTLFRECKILCVFFFFTNRFVLKGGSVTSLWSYVFFWFLFLFSLFYHYPILRFASSLVRCWLRAMSIFIHIMTSSPSRGLSSSTYEFKGKREKNARQLCFFLCVDCRLYVRYFSVTDITLFVLFCLDGVF